MEALTVKKSPVQIRREMVKSPGVLGVLEPIERAVFLASTAKTVAEYSDRDLAGELSNALRWIAKDVGYKSDNESDRQYLVIRVSEILKRYYGQLSLKDFRMAFEMCVTGELDDFLPKGRDGQPDRGHYQQFNAEYVCKVLNAYKSRRGWVLKKAYEAVPKKQAETKSKDMTETRRALVKAYDDYRTTGEFPKLSPIAEMLYYDILVEVGLAPALEVTDGDCENVLKRAVAWHLANGNFGAAKRMREAGTGNEDVRFDAYVTKRRKALRDVFGKMMTNNIDLRRYVKLED